VDAFVVSIHVTPAARETMRSVTEVLALPGRGLDGDRYFKKAGTYSNRPGTGRDVTLIEAEALEALGKQAGIVLNPGEARRNIVTRGIRLETLLGKEFRIGDVLLRGVRLCDPCSHLEALTVRGVLKGLVGRGGLRADILTEGPMRVGDRILIAEPVSQS
jgi:MOSC domain-containing protein YiiM